MNQPTPYNPNQPQQPNRSLANIIAALGPQSSVVEQSTVDPRALAAGIKSSFAVMTFKGKTWGIRHKGSTLQLLQRDAQGTIVGAIPTVDVIILKAATAISKSYYIEKYKEGDFNQPDCFSTNGQVPDPASPHLQNPTCRGCKWDAFGSRRMDDGRNAKACQDSKRIAIVPAADIKNEAFGGPMMLKLPPSAFNALSELEVQLHMQGYRYYGLVMRLSFDHTVAYPKIMITPIRVLNDHEMTEVLELQKPEIVDRILSEELFEVSADPSQPDPVVERPPQPQPTYTAQHHPSGAMSNTAVATQPRPEGVEVTAFNPTPPPRQPEVQQPQQYAPTTGFTAQPTTNGVTPPQPQNVQPTPPVETAEQKIARLEAQLAAASTAKKPGRKRSQPVTPGGGSVTVNPAQQEAQAPAQAFTAHATPAENGSAPEGDEDEGDTPADLDDRIDKLLKP